MVIWAVAAAARHILTWADICPARRRRRQHGVFTEANCYPSLPPFGGHQSRSGVHYPFSTDGPRVMGGRGRTEEGEGASSSTYKWEKDAKKDLFKTF